jgi:hypothetical protein
LTSRKRGRCHVITVRRKRLATQAILPPPPPQEADSPPKQVDLVKVAAILPRDGWSPKLPRDQMWKSRDKCGFGVKVAISPPIPQRVVLARNIFSKIDAENFYLPYCSVKICPPLSCEL